MKRFLLILTLFLLSLNCFSQKTDSIGAVEEKMKGFWICNTHSAKNIDSLYFGNKGIFYAAQYTSKVKGYQHHVGRWKIESDSGHVVLHVSYSGVEHKGNFTNYRNKLLFNKPFFFMGEEWHKME